MLRIKDGFILGCKHKIEGFAVQVQAPTTKKGTSAISSSAHQNEQTEWLAIGTCTCNSN
jgi:hypothetical protein